MITVGHDGSARWQPGGVYSISCALNMAAAEAPGPIDVCGGRLVWTRELVALRLVSVGAS